MTSRGTPYADNRQNTTTPSSAHDPLCNLIVNYLPASYTDVQLQNLFSPLGEIRSCRVMRNNVTKDSLGYGFVEFFSVTSAEEAVSKLNGLKLENKTLKVAIAAKRQQEIQKLNSGEPIANLYVTGLPADVDDTKLHSMFARFGEISTVKVMLNQNNESKGVGFVKFAELEVAKRAIDEMNGVKLENDTKVLTVKFAMPPKTSQDRIRERNTNLKVASGNIAISSLLTNSSVAQPVLQGIANASNYLGLDVDRVLTPLLAAQTSGISTQPVHVNNCNVVPGSGHVSLITGEVASIFVHGLPLTADVRLMYELFSPFGSILNVKPIIDLQKEGTPCKGYGFVNFRKREEARHAVVAMHGYIFDGKPLQVSFKDEDSKTILPDPEPTRNYPGVNSNTNEQHYRANHSRSPPPPPIRSTDSNIYSNYY